MHAQDEEEEEEYARPIRRGTKISTPGVSPAQFKHHHSDVMPVKRRSSSAYGGSQYRPSHY